MEDTEKTTTMEMLEQQIRGTLEDLEMEKFSSDEQKIKPLLEKLKVLYAQKLEQQKLTMDQLKNERQLSLDQQRLETDTAIRIRELEIKEESDKKAREMEEKKLEEQKRSNTVTAIIGGVTALTGIGGLIATVNCFKKGLQFEQTGSYTSKTSSVVGSIFRILSKR